jgi:hypothetical protein
MRRTKSATFTLNLHAYDQTLDESRCEHEKVADASVYRPFPTRLG